MKTLINLIGIKDELKKAAKKECSPNLTALIRRILIEWLRANNYMQGNN